MAHTLKKRYDIKQLHERLKTADKQLIIETRTSKLILEAMNEDDLNKVSQVIDKLRTMKGKGLTSLDRAIETAEAELNKYTGGGPLDQAWGKLKSKLGIDNPVVKIMTMADALEQGFKQMPMILKNNVGDPNTLKAQADKSISDVVTDPTKKKTVVDNMLKALAPKGIFGAFKKVPYIERDVLAQELTNIPMSTLQTIVQQGSSGASPQEVAKDIKDTATATGTAQTATTRGTEPGAPTAKTTGAAPAKNSTTTTGTSPTGETPPQTDQAYGASAQTLQKVKKLSSTYASELGLDAATINKVMLHMVKKGLLK